MPYEIYNRKVVYRGIPAVTISKFGRLSFNKAATDILQENVIERILMLWNKEKRFVGIQSIKKQDDRAFNVRYNKRGDGAGFTVTSFLKHIEYNASETRIFPVEWNDQQQMFEFEINSEYFVKEGFVTPMRRNKK